MKYRLQRFKDTIAMKIAYALPNRIAYWAAIRVIAHATTGNYSSTVVPELTAMDALKRFEDNL